MLYHPNSPYYQQYLTTNLRKAKAKTEVTKEPTAAGAAQAETDKNAK